MSVYDHINPAMIKLLRSRWHRRLSSRIMIVSYTGRKTGKHYDVPVSYYRDGQAVYCFTNGNWRHNFATAEPATLRLAGEDYDCTGELFKGDRQAQTDLMVEYFKAVPQDRKFYGVGRGSEPSRGEVEQATYVVDAIQFSLQ